MNMIEIIEFLEALFEKEQKAIYARHKKDSFEEYNILATEIISNMYDITVGLGLPVMRVPKPDSFYEGFENDPYPSKRIIYKISQYGNDKYDNIWACYVSESNPFKEGTIFSRFIIGHIDGTLKIIASFNQDEDINEWSFRGGDRDFKNYYFGKPIAIERIKSPSTI